MSTNQSIPTVLRHLAALRTHPALSTQESYAVQAAIILLTPKRKEYSSGVRHLSCKLCDQDIEGFAPYRRGEWRDRGNNTECPDDSGNKHVPYWGGSNA